MVGAWRSVLAVPPRPCSNRAMATHSPALVEEVRVAMALNGGVSLAVWMGGCAVELDCARRAHLGPEDVLPENGSQPPRRTIYNALCRAFRRELVLDLMSGSSAGGINGTLLATAIVHNRRLHPRFVRDRWIELGDFSTLLHKPTEPAPTSLMNGGYFKRALEDALNRLVNPTQEEDRKLLCLTDDDAAALAGQTVALDVTTTDVRGRHRTFRDRWGEDLVAYEYRGRFRFRKLADYTVEDLAIAARSSASFPLAFEPAEVHAELLALKEGTRWVIDGGLLDNAPIKAVLDLIPSRPASRQVQRYVCYVNADPPVVSSADGDRRPGIPRLEEVLGYTLNLPRQATFVDHLYAVERATVSGTLARSAQDSLLKLDRGALRSSAEELLSAYRDRRRLLSLRDLIDQPSKVELVYERLTGGNDLPWIPQTLDPPPQGKWGWGARAGQRVIHLLIDLVRQAGTDKAPEIRTQLFELRSALDARLAAIENAYDSITKEPAVRVIVERLAEGADIAAELDALSALMADPERDPAIRAAVEAAAGDVLERSALLAELSDPTDLRALFGDDWEPDMAQQPLTTAQFDAFLERTLAIEVVRRAFSADDVFETAQRLRFAQLTPCAPARLFAPRDDGGAWDVPDAKLTGIKWGHFAAFYRASWRANDFMWGRLDAAVRIMDLLVDPVRAGQVEDDGGPPPADVLAEALLPDDATEAQRWLIAEELNVAPNLADLRTPLRAALDEDLRADGARTRAICARAAQLEIVVHELPLVVAHSEADVALGTSAPAVDLDTSRPWSETIAEIRRGPTFPDRLGRDLREETASALAMRISTRAAFVGLAALRATKRPLTRTLYALRAPLLPVAGLVSQNLMNQLAVVLAFWSTALLIASRLATTNDGEPPVSAIWSLPVLATLLAAVGVLAIAAVPAWRAARAGRSMRRAVQLAWLALLLAAGGVAGLLCAFAGGLGTDAVLAQSDAWAPPDLLLGAVIAVTLAVPVALPLPFARTAIDAVLRKRWGDWLAALVTLTPWVILGIFAGVEAWRVLFELGGWRSVTAGLGLIGAPIALLAYLFASGIGEPPRRRPASGEATATEPPIAAPGPRPRSRPESA
jgi:predicted acylesterase/phospholipase RssA